MKTRAQKILVMENLRPTPQNNQPQMGIHHFQVPSPQFGRPVFLGGQPNHVFGEDVEEGLTIFWVIVPNFCYIPSPTFWEFCPAKGFLRGFGHSDFELSRRHFQDRARVFVMLTVQ